MNVAGLASPILVEPVPPWMVQVVVQPAALSPCCVLNDWLTLMRRVVGPMLMTNAATKLCHSPLTVLTSTSHGRRSTTADTQISNGGCCGTIGA